MTRTIPVLLFIFFAVAAHARTTYFPAVGVTIAVADSAQGARLSMISDEYTKGLTPFDLSIRLHETGLKEKDYLQAAAEDVRNWTPDETKKLQDAFAGIDSYLKESGIRLQLPDTVIMIKTTAKSEFEAEGWTRRNRIMLNQQSEINLHIVAHELFHVLSRNDAKTRDAVYAVFDFKPCNNIEYKAAMKNKVITNPDCPFLMHYVTVDVNGTPTDGALMLYSKNDYKAEYTMGDYAAVGLLALTGNEKNKKPVLKDGQPVVYELGAVPDLFTHIGMNTQYVLHIEEICAEHFAALMGRKQMNQQELLKGFEAALKAR